MLLRYMEMLRRRIAGQFDHLHAVKQRLRDRIPGIGRTDKEYMGQIIGQIDIMVFKCCILLRIQYFQKGRGRIPVKAGLQLVHLIEHHNRIHGPGSLDPVHDAPRQSSYIGSPVSPDLRLIPDAAQGNAHVLAPERFRDGAPHACLPGTRRPYEEQDRPLLPGTSVLFAKSHDGQVLQDPLLHFLQAVMVTVQDGPCFCDIDAGSLIRHPFKRRHKVQIIVK